MLDLSFRTGTWAPLRRSAATSSASSDPDYAARRADRKDAAGAGRSGNHEISVQSRASCSTIIELGLLPRRSPTRSHSCVRADGTLSLDNGEPAQGSIHRLGAAVQGKTACNGWTFWHHEVGGKLRPIDSLREEARRQLAIVPPQPLVAAE